MKARGLARVLLSGSGLLPLAAGSGQAQSPPPNIVFLLADDLGWTDLSTRRTNMGHGSDYYRTPHIDALAASGMAFDNAYTGGPNCTPTRAALMSGQHAARTGVYTVGDPNRGLASFRQLDGAPSESTLDPAVVTLAETLKAAGYATGHFGKWHLGDDAEGRGPSAQGFDVNRGGTADGSVAGGSLGHFAQGDGSWNLPNLPANGIQNQFMADRLTDEALGFMQQSAGRPFFCHLAQFSVHVPIQAPAAAIAAFSGEPRSLYHWDETYAGMLKNLDDNVGRIVDFLEITDDPARPGQKLIGNTVVIVYSDNGGLGGYTTAGIPGGPEITHQFPLQSGKGSLFEGGIRVPLIVRWDGRTAPGSIATTPITTVDFYPTLAAITGASLPSGQVLDGVDFSPLLLGQSATLPRTSLFWHFPAYLEASIALGSWRTTPVSVVRRGDYKLRFEYETRAFALYDLASDIGESDDLAAQKPLLVRSMAQELRTWLADTAAAMPLDKLTGQPVSLPDPPGRGDAVDWRTRPTSTVPTAVRAPVLVSTGSAVLSFGGDTALGPSSETWRFDGDDWQRLLPTGAPPATHRHAGCFDEARRRLVVFGGEATGGAPSAAAFELDAAGTTWSAIQSGPAPPARLDHALAYDTVRDRVVLFGGDDGNAPLADTWELDGSTWRELAPASAPPARSGHGIVHDPDSGRTYVFGGVARDGTPLGDTWAWDGTSWTELAPASAPSPRSAFAFAWDRVRHRAVLFGGRGAGGQALDDTWELDGQSWRQRDPAHAPKAAEGAAATFAEGLARTVLFGGFAGAPLAATWDYQTAAVGATVAFGQGCPGSAGTPRLLAQSRPWIGERFAVELQGLPAAPSSAFLLLGFSNQTWPLGTLPYALAPLGAPGCDLLVDPAATMPLHGLAGRATAGLPIPPDPAAIGLVFYGQALVLDPLANPAMLVASNGLDARIGAL